MPCREWEVEGLVLPPRPPSLPQSLEVALGTTLASPKPHLVARVMFKTRLWSSLHGSKL